MATNRLTALLPLWQRDRTMKDRQPLQVLTDYRQERGWRPVDLARFLEQPRPTVHRWETGARKIDEERLDDVSKKTGIPKRELRPDLAEVMREAAE